MLQAFRRSIVAARNINKGDKISNNDLDFKRPGIGMDPDKKKLIIGLEQKNIMYDEILHRKDFVILMIALIPARSGSKEIKIKILNYLTKNL